MAVLQHTCAPAPAPLSLVIADDAIVTTSSTPSARDAAWFPADIAAALDLPQNAAWSLSERGTGRMDGLVTLVCGGSFPHVTYTERIEPAESGDVLQFETVTRELHDGWVQLAQLVDGSLTLVEGRLVEWPGRWSGNLQWIESRIDWYDCATGLLLPPNGATLLGLLVKQRRSDEELARFAELMRSVAEQPRPAVVNSTVPSRKVSWWRRTFGSQNVRREAA